MSFGISEKSARLIWQALSRWEEIEKAAIFGSRARGDYQNGSDVDIAIFGSAITEATVRRLSALLNEELPLPYYFDVVHYESLHNKQLKNHIEISGKVFYKAGQAAVL